MVGEPFLDPDSPAALQAQIAALRGQLALMQAKRALEPFFQEICAVSAQLMYVHDLDLQRTVYVNRSAAPANGEDALTPLLHPEDRARVQAHLQRLHALGGGDTAPHEFRLQGADGWQWFEATHAVLQRRPDGNPARVLGCASEITRRKRAELALLDAPDLAALVEKAPMAVIEFDPQRVVRRWAGDAEKIFGWRADEALGRPLAALSMVHEDDRAAVGGLVARLLQGQGDGSIVNNRNLTKDGREIHCAWQNTVLPGEPGPDGQPGAPRGVLSMVLDVTAHRRAEEALRASEEHHRLLTEALHHGVVHQAANGRIIAMNPAAERILGKGPERLLGSDSVHEQHDCVREDGSLFPGEEHPAMQALKTGEPVRGVVMGVWNPQHQQWRWIRIDALPMRRNGQAQATEVVTVFDDITERRQTQQALRLSHQRFEVALRGSEIIVCEQDLALRYTWINNPGLDFSPEHVIGRTDLELCETPQEGARLQAIKRAVIDSGHGIRQEVTLSRGGRRRSYDLRVEPQRDAQGRCTGVLCVAIDVTERKLVELALRDADRHKDLFIATLAHELRNPLAPILNAASVLRAQAVVPQSVARCTGIIERQVSQMARLLDDLLDVSRVASGRLLLRPERLLLGTVVEQAVEAARPLIDAAGHTLRVHLPPEPVVLRGDRVRLAQVCANLLANATKYTQPRGHITIEAGREGDEAVIRVSDTGIGLAEEHLHSVFEMFGQVDGAPERSQGGMGIGLALARGLVEMHGGRISAHSAGPERGSEFVVRLPAPREQAAEPVAPPPAPAAASERPARRRVLVVDDNIDAAQTLALLLGADGHEVQIAHDGIEAFGLAETWQPDVALLDLGMPRLNGFDLCRKLREQPWGATMLVVAVSGWGQEQDRRRTTEAGFDVHLVKPVRHEMLSQLLDAAPPAAR